MPRSTRLTRRSAIALSFLAAALGFTETVVAGDCNQKCKKKKTKEQRIKCNKQCKQKQFQNPFPFGWAGFGPQVTGSLQLPATRAIATSSITVSNAESDNFIIWLHGPQSYTDLLVNEIPQGPGSFQFQAVVQLPADGHYFLEVMHADGSWRADFTQA